MAIKRKSSKKNKRLECECKLDTDAGFNVQTGKGQLKTSSCVCKRVPGKKELKGVGKVDLILS